MRIDRATAEWFLTFRSLDYTFEDKPLFVIGENRTDDNQQTNGVGKSGLAAIIEFCLFASNSREVVDADLINYDHKEAKVGLYVSCAIRRERLHIDWLIKRRGSNVLTIKRQDFDSEKWEKVDYGTAPDGKKYIQTWLAINKDDFFNYYVISQKRFKSFFHSSNTQKIDLMNRFSDLSIIEGLGDKEKDKVTAIENTIKTLSDKLISLGATLAEKKETLKFEESRDLNKELNEKVAVLRQRIEKTQQSIKSSKDQKVTLLGQSKPLQNELGAFTANLKAATDKLNNFKGSDFETAENKLKERLKGGREAITKQDTVIRANDKTINQAVGYINTLNQKLAGVITCPKCSHLFILDKEMTKEKAEIMLEKADKRLKELKTGAETLTKEKKRFSDAVARFEESARTLGTAKTKEAQQKQELVRGVNYVKQQIEEAQIKITNLSNDITAVDENVKREKDLIKQIEKSIDSMKVDNSERVVELKAAIETAANEIEETDKAYKAKQAELLTLNQWTENFKLFKMDMANKSLSTVEYHTNRYLSGMGVDMRVVLDGQKMDAKGKIKEEINARVVRGIDRPFGSFSGGEKGRLIFSSVLANKYMIDSVHPYGGLDFLIMDELFEGVDGLGLKFILESVKDYEYPILAITHVADEFQAADTLKFVKENGISFIEREEEAA